MLFLRTALLWAIAQQIVVIPYHYLLCKSPEERSSHLLRRRSLKSRIGLFLHYVFHRSVQIRYETTIVPKMPSANFKIPVHIVIVVKYNAIGAEFVVHNLFRPYIGQSSLEGVEQTWALVLACPAVSAPTSGNPSCG